MHVMSSRRAHRGVDLPIDENDMHTCRPLPVPVSNDHGEMLGCCSASDALLCRFDANSSKKTPLVVWHPQC